MTSRRGRIEVPARVSDIRRGTVFAPFHYGYWDQGGSPGEHPTAANELTLTEWDPVSKQPVFKNAAVKVEKIGDGAGPAPAPTTTASRPAAAAAGQRPARPTAGGSEAQATELVGAAPPPSFPDAIEPGRHSSRSGKDGQP